MRNTLTIVLIGYGACALLFSLMWCAVGCLRWHQSHPQHKEKK